VQDVERRSFLDFGQILMEKSGNVILGYGDALADYSQIFCRENKKIATIEEQWFTAQRKCERTGAFQLIAYSFQLRDAIGL